MVSARDVAEILSKIPLQVWNEIVKKEPEWIHMHKFLKRYGFGKFAVLMIVAGLNDYQLKGRAEKAYWPPLSNLLEGKPVPKSPEELINILEEFYSKERFSNAKIRRLKRFLSSSLAQELWTSKPEDVAKDFVKIWYRLAETMKQKGNAKTIAFAMKCLGISLLMAGETNFSFEKIPIPVDYKVKEFTKRLGVEFKNDDDIRNFWSAVLEELKTRVDINMIHLDSLIWQIGTLDRDEIIEYFSEFGLENIGRELVEVLR
ncbi:MAG TPA: N-glycosylase/DNA lyase [Thermococcus paralvinellae]|uniref:N-glycosylase/DNA lyase n=1 Tax=Thermococcus paralvinellae TaxID=582419 RepID=A0A832ZGG3_9EURY|nr:N-glycosylase/DNA lyase [Thermococcus paralvinellae]